MSRTFAVNVTWLNENLHGPGSNAVKFTLYYKISKPAGRVADFFPPPPFTFSPAPSVYWLSMLKKKSSHPVTCRPPAPSYSVALPLSLPPCLYTLTPLLSLPLPLSLLHFPWQAGDWHLQITRRQWHCVWPLSLISSPPPFCHLITVNPRPAPHCCIFNTPARRPSSRSRSPSSSHTRSPSSSVHLQPTLPASLSNTWSATIVSISSRAPSECFLSTASIITPSPLLPPLSALLLSVECHSIPHTDQSMSVSLFAFQFPLVAWKCLVNMSCSCDQ